MRASLSDIAEPVDMVQVFRKPEAVPPIADEAVAIGAKVLWLQLGVRYDAAAAKAEAAGLTVIQDRCPKIEFGRLGGELSWFGVDSGIVSAKVRRAPKPPQKIEPDIRPGTEIFGFETR